MHGLEHKRQGGTRYKINFTWFKLCKYISLPSMYVVMEGDAKNRPMRLLAGGLYTSMILFVAGFLWYIIIKMFTLETQAITLVKPEILYCFLYALLCNGCIQFFYGFYEMIFLDEVEHREYMIGHYILYIGIVIVFTVFWIKNIL